MHFGIKWSKTVCTSLTLPHSNLPSGSLFVRACRRNTQCCVYKLVASDQPDAQETPKEPCMTEKCRTLARRSFWIDRNVWERSRGKFAYVHNCSGAGKYVRSARSRYARDLRSPLDGHWETYRSLCATKLYKQLAVISLHSLSSAAPGYYRNSAKEPDDSFRKSCSDFENM